MVSYWSTELQLSEMGDITEWRRRYRSLVHYSVRHTIACYAQVTNQALTYQQIKQCLRAYSLRYYRASSRRAYFRRCEDIVASLQATIERSQG